MFNLYGSDIGKVGSREVIFFSTSVTDSFHLDICLYVDIKSF